MTSFCSYFNQNQCRSCSWIEMPYLEQIRQKEKMLCEALNFIPSLPLEKTIQSQLQGFRNRAKMSVTGSVDHPVIGLLGGEVLDHGRELLACPIHHPKLNEMISSLPEFIREYKLAPYQIQDRKGELKGLIAFYSPISDQMYLRFVLRSKECISRIKKLVSVMQNKFPSLVCISANIQPIPHAILEGPEEIILTEKGVIEHQIGPIRLNLAPQAFVQTNFQVASELYQTAACWIAEAKAEKILDLYCGQGAFSFFAAKGCQELRGIEINPQAVKMANETARTLGLTHVTFQCLDATHAEEEIQAFQPDLILVNPPRKGLGDGVHMIRRSLPAHFLYSSCSIQSLAHDLRILSKYYLVERIQLFDMFPHTEHFETLVWLKKAIS